MGFIINAVFPNNLATVQPRFFNSVMIILTALSCKNKEKAVNIIITELKNLGWVVARLFGNTALIVKPTKRDIENSVWGSSIDLEFC